MKKSCKSSISLLDVFSFIIMIILFESSFVKESFSSLSKISSVNNITILSSLIPIVAISRRIISGLYLFFFGTVATGEMFITDEKREEIGRRFAPLSVDMETAAVAHVCYVNKIPFLSVGTITDTSEYKGEENFDKNCEVASERAAEIVFGILDLFSSSERNRLK